RIEGTFERSIERQELSASVNRLERALSPFHFPRNIRGISQRIDEIIEDPRRRITHCGRSEQRQVEVGSRAHAPDGKRLAEVLIVGIEADRRRDIEQAADAERRVQQEAARVLEAGDAFALQELIDDRDRILEVREKIAYAPSYPAGRDLFVSFRDRLQRSTVERVVHLIDAAVESFP